MNFERSKNAMTCHTFRDRFAIVWIPILFGLLSCVAPNDSDDTPNTSIHAGELAIGWLPPVIANPPFQVFCGSSSHVNGAYYAVDIAAPYGDNVYASHGGVIEIAGWDSSGYGNLVKIRPADGSGFQHLYAHLQDIHPSVKGRIGTHVDRGQLIGWVGNTGNVTGTHLHFHVQIDQNTGVNLIGMTGFTAYSNYPSGPGVCGLMGG